MERQLFLGRSLRLLLDSTCALVLLSTAATSAIGQTVASQPTSLSYSDAWRRLTGVSHKLEAAEHEVRAARNNVDSVRTLHRPIVAMSAQALEYQKTISVNLTGAKQAFGSATDNFLNTLPNAFPPEFQDIVDQVTGKVQQAVPGLLATVPDSLKLKTRQEIFRPTATALMPIYTGGAIKAAQDAAAAGEELAKAKQSGTSSLTQVDLVKTYFGQQVAEQLLAAARETLDGFDRHLADARALEANGMIPLARVLEVQVARDSADRAYQRAEINFQTARDDLARLLQANGPIDTDTPLFVDSHPLPPVTDYISASVDNPLAREADAARDLARSGVNLAKSRLRPQVFAFGDYNFNRDHALATDPDWIAGVSVTYTLISNVGRNRSVAAARERERAAAELAADARQSTATETSRSYDLVEAARRNFLLLDSSLASTEENLRIQTIAFREGEAAISSLIDAQSSLAAARAQRVSAAYEYDLALAALLSASNRPEEFTDHLASADRRLEL